jgi:thiol-disulfide isomerase/thioredoxin
LSVEGPLLDAETSAATHDGSRGSTWPLVILLLLAVATLITLQMRRPKAADPFVGLPLPPLDAAGWLNTDRPLTSSDLRGQIVVLDFWATWCQYCGVELPDLVAFHQRYRDRGVKLIGLTAEPASELPSIERFIRQVDGVDWPIAYGAIPAYQVTGISGLPTYVLYNRNGMSVWSGSRVDELEEAVVELLAKK